MIPQTEIFSLVEAYRGSSSEHSRMAFCVNANHNQLDSEYRLIQSRMKEGIELYNGFVELDIKNRIALAEGTLNDSDFAGLEKLLRFVFKQWVIYSEQWLEYADTCFHACQIPQCVELRNAVDEVKFSLDDSSSESHYFKNDDCELEEKAWLEFQNGETEPFVS